MFPPGLLRFGHWLPLFLMMLVIGLIVPQDAAGASPSNKLNVLFIAVDDLNVQVGCYGYPVKTPNIDRLASLGRRFDRAYCQYPLCNPSRTSIMSGWRPEHTRVWGNQQRPRPTMQEAVWLQEYFRENGYFTARVGKIYHGGFENDFEWDVPAKGPDRAATPQTAGATSRPAAGRGGQRGGRGGRGAGKAQGGGEVDRDEDRGGEAGVPITWRATEKNDAEEPDGRTARRVAQLIEEHKDGPFFIGAGFVKPHLTWVCPRKYFDLYPPDSIQFDRGPADDLKDIPRIALTPVSPKDPHTDAQRREAIAAYHACTSFMDAQVGVLLETLDRLKLWDNTIVVLYGDHGWQLGEHGLWRKMALFEESARAPLIIVTPGIKQPGKATRELAEFVGLYPTLVELCGLRPVKGNEGTSLVPLLNNLSHAVIRAAFTVVARDDSIGKSVRTDRYRYTEWPGGGKELYDHQEDPREYVNLAADAKNQSVVEELHHLLERGYEAARIER